MNRALDFHPRELPLLRDQAIAAWRTRIGEVVAKAEADRTVRSYYGAGAEDIARGEVTILERADLYWISADMCALWGAAAETLPSSTLDAAALPSRFGLAVFEQPMVGYDSERDAEVTTAAIAWAPAHDERASFITIASYTDLARTAMPTAETMRFLWKGRLFPLGSSAWTTGLTWTQPGAYEGRDEFMLRSVFEDRRRLATLAQLLAQRVVVTARHQPSNAERKQAQRRGSTPSDVTVVTLRRAIPSPPSGAERDVEWTRRWIVSAHWRNQYYPSTGDHRPVLILPYEKGPPDKPLVVKPTVNVWAR